LPLSGYDSSVSFPCVLRRLTAIIAQCSEHGRDAEGLTKLYLSLTNQHIERDPSKAEKMQSRVEKRKDVSTKNKSKG